MEEQVEAVNQTTCIPLPEPGVLGSWFLSASVVLAWLWQVFGKKIRNARPEFFENTNWDEALDALAFVITTHEKFKGVTPRQVRNQLTSLDVVASLIEDPKAVQRLTGSVRRGGRSANKPE